MRTDVFVNWMRAFIYPRPLLGIFYLPRYFRSFYNFRKKAPGLAVRLSDSYPCLLDWTVSTPFDAHYFYQGAWLARRLARKLPEQHIDIGSSVMMVSIISAMTRTVFLDYRPLRANLSGLDSVGGSITNLPFRDNSLSSISCLHVIEHIGLGRYGDPVDPDGTRRAAAELERVLKPGGRLYLSLPVGRTRVCFNAHRIHDPRTVPGMFSRLVCVEFSCVNDDGLSKENCSMSSVSGSNYACGMYIFEKR